jgi:hypothetical protein
MPHGRHHGQLRRAGRGTDRSSRGAC